MIIVAGTKRSGTSLWMHILVEAGLPWIGERFPQGWVELLRDANPDGYFESELIGGINFQTNPHPLTGAYLAPEATRRHAVKVFLDGLVRTDVAFIDRVVATVREWRQYVRSVRRLPADDGGLPPALQWWTSNYGLLRDLAIRGYPVHVVSYDALLREPERTVRQTLAWIGDGDAERAAALVRSSPRPADAAEDDEALAPGIAAEHRAVFDALYAAIDGERDLDPPLIERLNRTDEALRPLVLRHHADASARAVTGLMESTR